MLGGGLLGLEAARGLAARGLDVTVVHPVGHLMERQLDPPAGAVLAGTLAGLGVRSRLGAAATAVTADADGVRLHLGDAEPLDADLLVLCCGVRPDTALAASAGLAVERGVVVDDRMRTQRPADLRHRRLRAARRDADRAGRAGLGAGPGGGRRADRSGSAGPLPALGRR